MNICAQQAIAVSKIQTLYGKEMHQHPIHMSLPLSQRNQLLQGKPK